MRSLAKFPLRGSLAGFKLKRYKEIMNPSRLSPTANGVPPPRATLLGPSIQTPGNTREGVRSPPLEKANLAGLPRNEFESKIAEKCEGERDTKNKPEEERRVLEGEATRQRVNGVHADESCEAWILKRNDSSIKAYSGQKEVRRKCSIVDSPEKKIKNFKNVFHIKSTQENSNFRTPVKEKSNLKKRSNSKKKRPFKMLPQDPITATLNIKSLFPKTEYIWEKYAAHLLDLNSSKSENCNSWGQWGFSFTKTQNLEDLNRMLSREIQELELKKMNSNKTRRSRKKMVNKNLKQSLSGKINLVDNKGNLSDFNIQKFEVAGVVDAKQIGVSQVNGKGLYSKEILANKSVQKTINESTNFDCSEKQNNLNQSDHNLTEIKLVNVSPNDANFGVDHSFEKKLTEAKKRNVTFDKIEMKEVIGKGLAVKNVKTIESKDDQKLVINFPRPTVKKQIQNIENEQKVGKGKVRKRIQKLKVGRSRATRRVAIRRKIVDRRKDTKFKYPTYAEVKQYIEKISLLNWADVDPYHEQKIKGR